MYNWIKYLLYLLCGLVLTTACIREADGLSEDTYIRVSEESISVPKGGEDRLIHVETNARDWSYISPQEGSWISLSREEHNLRVVVAENPTAAMRRGSIVIVSGSEQREIAVEQTAADIHLELIGNKEGRVTISDIPAAGGVRSVDFFANSEEVIVEVTQGNDWLLVKDKSDTSLVVEIMPNEGKVGRTATVEVRSGQAQQTLVVSQSGKLYYVLPLIGKTVTLNQALTFERERSSTRNRIPTDRNQQNIYRLNVASEIAPLVQYQYNTPNQLLYNEAAAFYVSNKHVIDNAEFDQFMKDNGFDEKGKDPTGRFVQYSQDPVNGDGFMATVLDAGENGAAVFISQGVRQTEEQPSFATFPLAEEITYLGAGPELERGTGRMLQEPIAGRYKMGLEILTQDKKAKTGTYRYKAGGIFAKEVEERKATFHEQLFWRDTEVCWYTFLRQGGEPIARIKYYGVTKWDYEGILLPGDPLYNAKYEGLKDDVFRLIGITPGEHYRKVFFITQSGMAGLTREFLAMMRTAGFEHSFQEEQYFFFYNKATNTSLVVVEIDNQNIWLDVERSKRADASTQMQALRQKDFARFDRIKAERRAYIQEIQQRIKLDR